MSEKRMTMKRLTLALAGVAILLSSMAAPAVADDEVGCWSATIRWTDTSPQIDTLLWNDENVEYAIVGQYAWIRNDGGDTQDSLTNVVSYEIPPNATEITVCTTHWSAEYELKAPTAVYVTDGPAVVVSTIDPHPSIAEAWIIDQGLTIL